MKKVVFLAVVVLALASCTNSNQQKQTEETQEVAIGGEKDEHGCLTAAGESWSELRQTCLQIFDEGIRLNPVEVTEGEAVISAFVLFNDDQSKVEVFLTEGNVILPKSADNIYEVENYKFDARNSVLFIDGVEKFKGE